MTETRSKKIAVVFPCFNPTAEQWRRLVPFVEEARALRPELDMSFLVADDGSERWTEPPADARALVRVHRFAINEGKGGVLKKSVMLLDGDCDVFAFMDFDLPYTARELVDACGRVLAGAAICVGERSTFGAKTASDRRSRRLAHRALKGLIAYLLSGHVLDSQCGVKAFDFKAARRLASVGRLKGFLFDIEWLYIASVNGWRIAQQPVLTSSVHASTPLARFLSLKLIGDFVVFLFGVAIGRYRLPAAPIGGVTEAELDRRGC